MAVRHKIGLDYFPLDVDFFMDEKIEFASARFGLKGELIAIKLLCKIYRNGYYSEWSEDDSIIFAKRAGEGITPSLVNEVVQELVKRGFFNKSLLDRFSILTSTGIQNRYFEAVERRKSVEVLKDYVLIDISKYPNVSIMEQNVNISPQNDNILQQSKVEESKVEDVSVDTPSVPKPKEHKPKPILFKDSEYFDKEKFAAAIAESKYPNADVEHYYESLLNWSNSNHEKKYDWMATVKNWMGKDIKEGKFICNSNRQPQHYVNGNRPKQNLNSFV